MTEYLFDKKDGFKYTHNCAKYIKCQCPNCGRVRNYKISDIYRLHHMPCVCNDKMKYPNKFMYSILEQNKVEFITEYSPKWLGRRRFDFYIPSKKIIIEMDGGLGHGKENLLSKQSSEETKMIDQWKDQQANEHNLKVIRIDCDYGTKNRFNYIKESILLSELKHILVITDDILIKANKFGLKSMTKDMCAYYETNKNNMSLKDMAKNFKVGVALFVNALKNGSELGWCAYKPNNKKRGDD